MSFENDIQIILDNTHPWNWCPDLMVLKKIYNTFPESFSVLTPFAYSYLEECIRSTTSEYGIEILDENGKPKRRKTGKSLIALAKEENSNNLDYINILNEVKSYFEESSSTDVGNNRNSVDHGYMHPRNWSKESFEYLIHDIARISPFVRY